MSKIAIYGIGSPILIDVEESAHRAGLLVALGIRNVAGESRLSEGVPICEADAIPPEALDLAFLVPLFTPGRRQQASREAEGRGLTRHATLIDPTAILPRALSIGPGSYVNAGCVIGGGGAIGAFALLNRGVNLGHHARLGRFVSIGPGAVIAGGVTLGDGAVVGAGATVLPSLTIGANAVVGAGAVVGRDVPDECLVMGAPARIVRRGIGGHNGARVG